MLRFKLFLIFTLIFSLGVGVVAAQTDETEPWQTADALHDTLFQAQSALLASDTAAATNYVAEAQTIATALSALPTESQALLTEALHMAETAVSDQKIYPLSPPLVYKPKVPSIGAVIY